MSCGIGLHDHIGIGHIALDVSLIVRCSQHALQGTVAVHLNCDEVIIIVHHGSHHNSACHKSSESSR